MEDRDLNWLKGQKPKIDYLDVKEKRAASVYEKILSRKKEELPLTIGVFGNWGCGKSSFLAILAEMLEKDTTVIYFNAWRYAGFMEIVPALVYKILSVAQEAGRPEKESCRGNHDVLGTQVRVRSRRMGKIPLRYQPG